MKRLFFILIFLAFSVPGFNQEFDYYSDFNKIRKETKKKKSATNYEKLLDRYLKPDTTLSDFEVLSLMIGFVNQKQYDPLLISAYTAELYELNRAEQYDTALIKAKNLFQIYPLSEQLLVETAYSLFGLNQLDSAKYYGRLQKSLLRAMNISGDGLTKESPIFSLDKIACQNYVLLYLRRGLGFIWTIKDSQGQPIEMIETFIENDDGTESVEILFFKCEH